MWRAMFGLVSFLIVSYLVVMGFVLMVLAAMQEAAQDRPHLQTRWKIAGWSRARFVVVGALLTLPALFVLVPIGLIFIA